MSHFTLSFRAHRNLILLSVAYMAAVTAAIAYDGGSARRFWYIVAVYTASSSLTVFFILAVLCVFMAQAALAAPRHRSPVLWLKDTLAGFEKRLSDYGASFMPMNAFWGLVAMLPLLTFFSMSKSLIPSLAGFTWDPLLARADRMIHFGHYPHEWLMPLTAWPGLVRLFDNSYMAWFGVMFAANGFCLFCDRDPARRMRYLWSFALCWIVCGTVMAFLFASCGPVFYHTYYPSLADPYGGLVAWLQTAKDGGPTDTQQVAGALYGMVSDPIRPNLNGISAMPSQHVAVAWLIALYARGIDKTTGGIAFVYAIIILLASVMLGWHYAVDGYAGIAVVSLIWWLCGKFCKPVTQ